MSHESGLGELAGYFAMMRVQGMDGRCGTEDVELDVEAKASARERERDT